MMITYTNINDENWNHKWWWWWLVHLMIVKTNKKQNKIDDWQKKNRYMLPKLNFCFHFCFVFRKKFHFFSIGNSTARYMYCGYIMEKLFHHHHHHRRQYFEHFHFLNIYIIMQHMQWCIQFKVFSVCVCVYVLMASNE